MSNTDIAVENIGPIKSQQFTLKEPGVTIYSAPNGSGKSILLDSVLKAAAGEGKLPLKDGERAGRLEAFGAMVTLSPRQTRHNGEFDVVSLVGRFDLAKLVDPGIIAPAAADRARIKEMVRLTGVKAAKSLFTALPVFADFDSVATPDCEKTDDLVEMAARVKKAYHEKARQLEATAEREEGAAATCASAMDGLNESDPSDEAWLAWNHEEAVKANAALQSQKESYEALARNVDAIRSKITPDSEAGETVEAAEAFVVETEHERMVQAARIAELEQQLQRERECLARWDSELRVANERVRTAKAKAAGTKSLTDTLEKLAKAPCPTDEELGKAATALERAKKAINAGAVVRAAKAKLAEGQEHRTAAADARSQADALRSAAAATDDVLSAAIQCDHLKVETIQTETDTVTRLVVPGHGRGPKTFFHDLSAGEKWRLAIDLGADQVGQGGLLVIEQEGWEGLDAFVQPEVHEHAKARGVYVLTAQATRDPADGREPKARLFGEQ